MVGSWSMTTDGPARSWQMLSQDGSVHRAAWPALSDFASALRDGSAVDYDADQRAYDWATLVLFEVRKQRSEAKQPLRVPITKVTIRAEAAAAALMPHVEADLKAALRVQQFEWTTGEPREFVVSGYETHPAGL